MNNKRLSFITPEYPSEDSFSGGLANYLGRVTVALAERGHEVHVFTKSYVANEVLDYRGVAVHRVVPLWDKKMRIDRIDRLTPRSLYAPYQDFKAAWSLWKRWKQEHRKQKFDLVQVANVLAVGLCFKKVRDVPVVMRLSSYRPTWDTAAGISITRSVKARWAMEKSSIRRTKYLYAPTNYVADLTEKNYGVKNIQVIETPFFHEEPTPDYSVYEEHCQGKQYVLFFGRMTQMKGVHLLAQALPGLLERHADMHAVFIGGDSVAPGGCGMHEYLRQELKAYFDRITILDSMRHDKLYPMVQKSCVVAIPSLIDNLPNTCLEAMSLKRIVVATTGSCFEQLIRDGHSGILVEPNHIDALATGIERAWTMSEDQRNNVGEHAAERIQKLHPDTKIPELIAFYQSIIDSH